MSLKEEPESESKRKRSESPEFTSIKHEHTDLSEESSDHEHKNKRAKSERAHSPAPSYMSLSSDWSIEPPTNFKSGEAFHFDLSESKKRICELPTMKEDHVEITHLSKEPSDEHKNIRVKSERAASPTPSYMSLRTDWSMEPPTNLQKIILDTSIKEEKETITISTNNQMDNTLMIRVRSERAPSPTLSLWSDFSVEPPAICKAEDAFPLDSRLLTSHHLKCPVCKSLLKDPVSILCGHNCCRGCINEFWDNCAGDYVCPQCGNPSETRPVLNTNTALAEVVKNLQQAAFSPALPPQSYAGPEDVACDFCTEQRLKAVKCCLTCVMSLCETHVRQHYTIPALQKHTLSDVTGDMKAKPSQEHQNTDNSFSSTTGQQDQTDKTQDVIEEEVRSISESALNICTSEMAVNKDTDVRSLELLCSKLQQEVSGLKKSLSNLKEKKTKKEKYFDEDYGEEDEDDDDDDDDDDDYDDDHNYDDNDDYDDEDYNEKDSDAENYEEEDGDEDFLDDAEGYTDDDGEEKDDYNEDYDGEDYSYSEDDKDEEDIEDDEDEDFCDEDY